MSAVLFRIPLARWVRRTIEKMNAAGKDDYETWKKHWYRTYKELGGQSETSGSKECPKRAAYSLWRLGRISDSRKAFQNWTLERVNEELGKNAAYAVLALDLLERGRGKREPGNWSRAELWTEVQELYQKRIGELPAQSEQGAVKVAMGLFMEGHTFPEPKRKE